MLLSIFFSPQIISYENENQLFRQEVIIKKNNEIQIKKYQNDCNDFFSTNLGQVGNPNVKFYIEGKGVWFTNNSVVFELKKDIDEVLKQGNNFELLESNSNNKSVIYKRQSIIVILNLINCNNIIPSGKNILPHKSNFFYGNNSSMWFTDVPNYQEVYFKNIYDNIDLRYYFNDYNMKYDFIVHPGANPNNIAFKVSGAEELILGSGIPEIPTPKQFDSMTIKTGISDIIDKNLFVYQESDEQLLKIQASFKLIDDSTYGFSILDEYNQNKDLIIDPDLFSTYLGGSNNDTAVDVQIDNKDNIYVTGTTYSSDFPIINESYDNSSNLYKDIFLLKMKPDGTSLIYSTFIGGNGNDTVHGLALDSDYCPYLTGSTTSSNFPTTSDAIDSTYDSTLKVKDNVILSKINKDGSDLEFSSYISAGGVPRYETGIAYDIAVTNPDEVYIAGTFYQKSPEIYIVFLHRYKLPMLFQSTGGGGTLESSSSYSLAIDKDGTVILARFLKNSGTHGNSMYITRYNKDLYLPVIGSIFFGPENTTRPSKVLVDDNSNVIITGYTKGNDLKTTTQALQCPKHNNDKGFIAKFSYNLSTLIYSTYFNAGSSERINDAVLGSNNTLYFTGVTTSNDFPIQGKALDRTYNGGGDAFIAALDIDNSQLKYSTYIGGNESDIGYGIILNDAEIIFITGKAGRNFPTSFGTYAPNFNGGDSDAFLTTFAPDLMDLRVSKEKEYRGHSVILTSNVSNLPSLEKTYIPHYEYRAPGENDWKNELLSSPAYFNDHWEAIFSIPKTAKLGAYSFRVRYKDTYDQWSKWLYLNGSFRVLNNLPQVDYLNLSKFETVIGDTIQLTVNGSDYEDDLTELDFKPEIRHNGSSLWDPLEINNTEFKADRFVFSFSFDPGVQYGDYYFRVIVYDIDTGYSDWKYLDSPLLLKPASPEVISIEISKNQIYRNDMVEVYLNCSDVDSSYDELFMELQYHHFSDDNWKNLSVDPINNRWEGLLNIKRDWQLGNYSFRTRAIDMESNPSNWKYLNDSLLVLNNIPKLISIKNIPETSKRGVSIEISLNAKDIEDNEDELFIKFEYRSPGENHWNNSYIIGATYSDNSWNYKFALPFSASNGYYNSRARACDQDGEWSDYFYLNNSLLVYNLAPEVQAFKQSPDLIFRTDTITITAKGNDLETPEQYLNCSIYFLEPDGKTWQLLSAEFNESSDNWNSELVTTISSVMGNYSFKVYFIDSDGASSKTWYYNHSVWVKNNLPEISEELDDIEVGKNQRILKLTDYGFDVETSKSELKWIIDQTSINTKLFHVETENIGEQEIVIYPVKSKEGKDDITITLIDADNGRTVKKDITIIVNSKSDGKTDSPNNDITISNLTNENNYWLYLIILLIIIALIGFFIYYRRKKKTEKEESEQKEILEEHLEEIESKPSNEDKLHEDEDLHYETEISPPESVIEIKDSSQPEQMQSKIQIPKEMNETRIIGNSHENLDLTQEEE